MTQNDEPLPPLTELFWHFVYFWRRWLAIGGACLIPVIILAIILPVRYTAEATLVVLPAPEFTVRPDVGTNQIVTSPLTLDAVMRMETAILESADLRSRVIHEFGASALFPWLQDDQVDKAIRAFDSALTVLPAKDANVISLRFSNRHAVLAAHALNQMLTAYADKRAGLLRDPQLAALEQDAAEQKDKLNAANLALTAFKRRSEISDFAVERDLALHRRDLLLDQELQLVARTTALRARLAQLESSAKALSSDVSLYHETDLDQRVSANEQAMQDLAARLASARLRYVSGSRVLEGLEAEWRTRNAGLKAMTVDARPSLRRDARDPSYDPISLQIHVAKADLAAAEAEAVSLRDEISELKAKISRLDSAERDLADLQRDVVIAESLEREANRALVTRRLAEAEEARRLGMVRVVQAARIPDRPSLVRWFVLAGGIILSGLGAAVACFLDYLAEPIVYSPRWLTQVTGLPVIAELPIPGRRRETVAPI